MVLVGDRRAEQGHDPVAGELVDRALEAVDALAEDREEAVHDPPPLLGVALLGELHRAHHVGEQHRHLLALALQGAAAGADLLGEVLRGMRARVGRGGRFADRRGSSTRRRHAPAQALQNSLAGGVRGAAARTRETSRRAASRSSRRIAPPTGWDDRRLDSSLSSSGQVSVETERNRPRPVYAMDGGDLCRYSLR